MAAIEHPARHILVATDFSESAEEAFATAVDYARVLHARLHLLHVFAPTDVEVTRLLADAASKPESDVPVAVASAAGDPAQEILKYATRHPIDLIVMGTHGRTGVSRVLLGSVADRVIRGAACPVLVVPMPRMATARGASAPAGVAVNHKEAEPSTAERRCLVCATPTRDLICPPCRARVRDEAVEQKQREGSPETL